jgi:histidinol-phosphate/aromatic aminotransferase/cobyric acid decarboxylase-like protein
MIKENDAAQKLKKEISALKKELSQSYKLTDQLDKALSDNDIHMEEQTNFIALQKEEINKLNEIVNDLKQQNLILEDMKEELWKMEEEKFFEENRKDEMLFEEEKKFSKSVIDHNYFVR